MTISYDYANYTMFGIKSEAGRHALAGWLVFVVLSSLLGDSLILLASVKYRAINLHNIIVTFIQHIAVCDLLNSTGKC